MSVMCSKPSRPSRSDERTEIGDVLDRALDRAALFDAAEQLRAFLGAFGFNELTAGENDVLALFVQLDDFALEGLAFVNAEIFRRDDINLRAGQKCLDAHVEHETTLDHGLHLAGDQSAVVENLDNLFPVLLLGGLLLGENDHTLVVFEALQEHFDFGADFEVLIVFEFAQADDAFGLVANVDEDFIGTFLQDASLDDTAFGKRLHRFA